MSYRRLRLLAVPVIALVTPVLAATSVAGQPTSSDARRQAGVSPTAWGDPDLQGVWTSSGATPMERPDEYQGRETLSDAEVARIKALFMTVWCPDSRSVESNCGIPRG